MTNEPSPGSGVRFITISEDDAGQRIDNFLLRELKGVPRTRIYRLLRKGEVRVNKGRIGPSYKLVADDLLRLPPIRVAERGAPVPPGQGLADKLHNSVLYEDKGLLVINKPAGLAVHGGSGLSLGLIEALRQIRPDDRYLELVHRLDRETSGCVMIARKRSVLRHLQACLRDAGQVRKNYLALVAGQWPKQLTSVDQPLLRNELKSGERIVRVDAEGKSSLTRYRLVESFEGCSLVEASPVTGRTHQIRVHAQWAGHPLLGDSKYCDDDNNRLWRQRGLRRLFLHAASITVPLPDQSQPLTVEAPLDEELQQLLVSLRRGQ